MTTTYQQLVARWLKGHPDACTFINDCFDIFHAVDDVTDGDATVTAAEWQDRLTRAMVTLPRNPFYQQHFLFLNGLIQMSILNWQIANALEVGQDPNGKEIAYILRSSYNDLLTACALLIGGPIWAVQVGTEARVHAASEGFATYCHRLTLERRTPTKE